MNMPHYEQAKEYAENRLARELSPKLVYHGLIHTRDEVVPAVERLAGMEGIRGKQLNLLRTAAWFHDLGYVESAVYHELIGARIAVAVLPSFGYGPDDVELVRWAILATALPQSPGSLLEEILTDADLDVLGRDDFMKRNRDLRQELAFLGKQYTDEQWFRQQLRFLEGHQYFTAAARHFRNKQKLENLNELKKILALYEPSA
jgi:uncharacterized protein